MPRNCRQIKNVHGRVHQKAQLTWCSVQPAWAGLRPWWLCDNNHNLPGPCRHLWPWQGHQWARLSSSLDFWSTPTTFVRHDLSAGWLLPFHPSFLTHDLLPLSFQLSFLSMSENLGRGMKNSCSVWQSWFHVWSMESVLYHWWLMKKLALTR